MPDTPSSSLPAAAGTVLHRGTPEYDLSHAQYFNKEDTARFPAEIHVVRTSADVSRALARATELKVPVGVRAGGHLPSKPSLIQDGILVDVSQLNHEVAYDGRTHEVCFGPGVRVFEAWKATDALGRFFPFGHAPDVALGGFCLAGGQGFFMRGWGATVTEWIVRLEIVMADGRALTASRTENQDLFWAARGAGQAFFGVVTRFWSKTVPKRRLFGRTFVFRVGDRFEDLIAFALERNNATPKRFTESAMCTMHSEIFDSQSGDESVPQSSPLLLCINASAYADTLAEAKTMLSAWDQVPGDLQSNVLEANPVAEVSWEEFFQDQHRWNPQTPDQKWVINSILNDPSVPLPKMLEAIKPALCNLPTRSSYGCLYMCDTVAPDENDAVFSIPQQYYISTFGGWKSPSLRPQVQDTLRESYKRADSVACGIYIADFDQSIDSLHSPEIKVWTDSARDRWMEIRKKWDPQGLFPGYKAFAAGVKQKGSL
ncbi:uncharacterized protein MKZ38_001623 [Zalerion maritima]|uniref:FAD-binding PCMH-type domain-containing protein n=1 Tax=Zalerion maritima TaxID=339359 RepID=A0AAD5RQ30_9PEZI|nr:uncharacterized protein MKZ38_001623 [Zalerion maritima]